VQWADVLAGVSACRELQVLVLPRAEVESLFPPGTSFNRLTHLEMPAYEREHAPNAADAMGLWEVMAGVRWAARLGRAQGYAADTWVGPGGGED
jgi:hypothetical protein